MPRKLDFSDEARDPVPMKRQARFAGITQAMRHSTKRARRLLGQMNIRGPAKEIKLAKDSLARGCPVDTFDSLHAVSHWTCQKTCRPISALDATCKEAAYGG